VAADNNGAAESTKMSLVRSVSKIGSGGTSAAN
jgi:hypothetical protein